MFGYACSEQDNGMPLAIDLSHRLVQRRAEVRKAGLLEYLRPDEEPGDSPRGWDLAGVTRRVYPACSGGFGELRHVEQYIIDPVVPESLRCPDFRIIVNLAAALRSRTSADCGLRGARLSSIPTVAAPHGGGAFRE